MTTTFLRGAQLCVGASVLSALANPTLAHNSDKPVGIVLPISA